LLRKLKAVVWRQEAKSQGRLVDYHVEVPSEGMVVDALFAIQAELDSSLAFRVNCRAGMCGSCALRVDGRERLACQTPLSLVGDTVRIEPLRYLSVLKDLVVDLAPFFEKYGRIHPEFRALKPPPLPSPQGGGKRQSLKPPPVTPSLPLPARGRAIVGPQGGGKRQSAVERELLDRALNCISCGACYSACDVVGLNPSFLGPAALARAWALVGDLRDGDPSARLEVAAGGDGIWRCHNLGVCTTVCPKAVAPTLAIQALRRRSLWRS